MIKSLNQNHYLVISGLVIGAALFSINLSADVTKGKLLHDKNCLKCHDTAVYTRKDRRVQSYEALTTRVKGCYKVANVNWKDSELKAVVNYLNTSFYKFKTSEK